MEPLDRNENLVFWKFFARWYDTFVNTVFPETADVLDRVVGDASSSECVVEMATGTGRMALELASKCGKVEAIDYSEDMIRLARKKAQARGIENVRFTVQNLYRLDFEDGRFDTVVCANVLQVLRDPAWALAEARRVLKPGGRLIAPTFLFGHQRVTKLFAAAPLLTGLKVYHQWTMDSLRRFVESCRFEVVRDDFIPGLVPRCYLIGRRGG